jgi:hypothetical protein
VPLAVISIPSLLLKILKHVICHETSKFRNKKKLEILFLNCSLLTSLITTETFSSSFLGSTGQLRPWPPPQNPAEFLGGFSTIFFFTG